MKHLSIRCSLILICIFLLAGCGSHTSDGNANISVSDTHWQPPEPKTWTSPGPTPVPIGESADGLIAYEIIGPGLYKSVTITRDGMLTVLGYGPTDTYAKIPNDELVSFTSKFESLGFPATLTPAAEEERDQIYFAITYRRDDEIRRFLVTNDSPAELQQIRDDLDRLAQQAVMGEPPTLVSYYLAGSKVWVMSIDVAGGVSYWDEPPVAHLPQSDLDHLEAMFQKGDWSNLSDWYAPLPNQRNMETEHRAIVGYKEHEIDVLTGADVAPTLDAILQQLASIYDMYNPTK